MILIEYKRNKHLQESTSLESKSDLLDLILNTVEMEKVTDKLVSGPRTKVIYGDSSRRAFLNELRRINKRDKDTS